MLVPAAATFAAIIWLGDFDQLAVARAIVFATTAMLVSGKLRDFPYPLRLLPASRYALAVLPMLAGVAVAACIDITQSNGVSTSLFLAASLGIALALAIKLIGDEIISARPLRIAVVGAQDFVPAMISELEADGGRREVEVVGWLNLGGRASFADPISRAHTLDQVRDAIQRHEIDLLVRGPGSGASRSGRDLFDQIAAGCLDLPVRMIDGNQLYEHVFGHVPIGTIDSAWFLFLKHPRFQQASRVSSRVFDLVLGSVVAVLALPLIGLGALAIKLFDRGPAFYRQTRVGEHGHEFEIIKLRTMQVAGPDGPAQWSVSDDPRVTGVGGILRRLHIDELPQVINVLRGDMTLVGPRPEQPAITAELERKFPHFSRRLLVKPGVTGWAQVRCGYAGSELGSAWKLCHDLFYLKHRSTLIDVLIMLETLVIAARDSQRPMRAPQEQFLIKDDPGMRIDLEPEAAHANLPSGAVAR